MIAVMADDRLDEDSFRALVHLLHRHRETDLDQWDRWRLTTAYGEVFITIRRYPEPGSDPSDFDSLDHLLPPTSEPPNGRS